MCETGDPGAMYMYSVRQPSGKPKGSNRGWSHIFRFDVFFAFQYYVENDIKIHEILRKGKENKIISMTAGANMVRFWDMCLFTFASLAKVCESMGVPKTLQKQGFDHNKIRTWTDVALHTEEVCTYNFFDVLCLALAYRSFGKVIAEEFNHDISKSCTLSQLAYTIWTSEYMTSKECGLISLPADGEDYKWMRRGLFGGRCQPQQKYFESKEHSFAMKHVKGEDFMSHKQCFDSIHDAKSYLDVSSLYPAASCMRNKFPMGRYRSYDNADQLENFLKKMHSISRVNPMDETTVHSTARVQIIETCSRSMFEVDVTCPDNINVPFLLERSKDGSLKQNLLPKTKQVYDGITLMMAQYCGYTITKIHRRVSWEALGTPLERFMVDVYQRKSDAAKTSAEYMIWKLLMNSLTGKMSQQWISTDYSVHRSEEDVDPSDGKFIESHEIIKHSKTNKPIAIGVTISDPTKMPSKPIHMGVWILAISRCMMMDMYMKLNLVSSPRSMSSYGDTDSFIPSIWSLETAKAKYPDIFGEKLGLLADEIGGGKIIRAWFISPKVYMIEYVTPDMKLKWKIRAKGIPRANQELDALKYSQNVKTTEQLIEWHHENPLSRPLFGFQEDDNNVVISEVLDATMFDAMLGGTKVLCVYGSMKRGLVRKYFHNSAAAISFDPKCYRTVNAKDWWKSGARSNPGDSQDYSVPEGHRDFKTMNTH